MLKGYRRGSRNTPFLPHRKLSCTVLTILPGQLMQFGVQRATYMTWGPAVSHTSLSAPALLSHPGARCWSWQLLLAAPSRDSMSCTLGSHCREGMAGRAAQHVAVKCGVTDTQFTLYIHSVCGSVSSEYPTQILACWFEAQKPNHSLGLHAGNFCHFPNPKQSGKAQGTVLYVR